jgi:dihydroflavonol-4-reductase
MDPDSLEILVKGCDAVIHAAARISIHGDPDGSVYRTNTEGTRHVLEACTRAGVKRLIHLSSVHAVMELPLDEPFDERRPYKAEGSSRYDLSKAVSEQYLLDHTRNGKLETVIVRPSSVVGPLDARPSEMGKALIDMYLGKVPLLPQGGYDFVDVRDVARSIIAALEKGRHGEVYLLCGKYQRLADLAAMAGKVTGKKMPGFTVPISLLYLLLPLVKAYGRLLGAAPQFTRESLTALEHGHPHMDARKAREELGHQVRPMEETLKDFYAWQKEHHNID